MPRGISVIKVYSGLHSGKYPSCTVTGCLNVRSRGHNQNSCSTIVEFNLFKMRNDGWETKSLAWYRKALMSVVIYTHVAKLGMAISCDITSQEATGSYRPALQLQPEASMTYILYSPTHKRQGYDYT